jgi:hypothetical protein
MINIIKVLWVVENVGRNGLQTFSRNLLPPSSGWKCIKLLPPEWWQAQKRLRGIVIQKTIILIYLRETSDLMWYDDIWINKVPEKCVSNYIMWNILEFRATNWGINYLHEPRNIEEHSQQHEHPFTNVIRLSCTTFLRDNLTCDLFPTFGFL